MEQVIVKPPIHHDQECIGIYVDLNVKINNALNKAGAKWSRAHRCWYIPLNKKNYDLLRQFLNGLANINNAAVHQYLTNKKNNSDKNLKLPEVVVQLNREKQVSIQAAKQAPIKKKNLPSKKAFIRLEKYIQQMLT